MVLIHDTQQVGSSDASLSRYSKLASHTDRMQRCEYKGLGLLSLGLQEIAGSFGIEPGGAAGCMAELEGSRPAASLSLVHKE